MIRAFIFAPFCCHFPRISSPFRCRILDDFGIAFFSTFWRSEPIFLSKSRRIKSPQWVLGENCAKMAPKNFSRGTTFPSKIDPGAQRDFWMQFGNHLAPFWLPFGALWLPFGSLLVPFGSLLATLWFDAPWLHFY